MSRWWNEFTAAVAETIPPVLLVLLLLVVATVVAVLWYWYPAWVRRPRLRGWRPRWPRLRWRWPRWRWPGWRWPTGLWARWRRRRADSPDPAAAEPAEEMPELPATDFANLADRLAAEGRYAEAVRERLRGMVRVLIERGIVHQQPGWTVTELAAAASARRPALAGPLGEAGMIFSDIWYGQRPADAAHDARMRDLAATVSAAVAQPAGPHAVTIRQPVGAS
jgi:hypothetical protein